MRLLFFLLITNVCLGQGAKSLFDSANDYFERNQYSQALSKLNHCEKTLRSSNALIENLKVKCYFELGQYEKAEKSLQKFFKYKAADYLIDEMLEYGELMRKARAKKLIEYNKNKEKEELSSLTEILPIDEIEKIEKEIKGVKEEIKEAQEKLEFANYEPYRKFFHNNTQHNIERLADFKEGKVYLFHEYYKAKASAYKKETSYFVCFDNRYVIINIPGTTSQNNVEKMQKDNIKFTSTDAKKFGKLWQLEINIPKLNTSHGVRDYSFLPLYFDNGEIIGGEGDNLIRPSILPERLDYGFYYFLVDEQVTLLSKSNYVKDKDLKHEGKIMFSTPIVEIGKWSINTDYRLIEGKKNMETLKERNVKHNPKEDYSDDNIINLELHPNGKQYILGVHKKIHYSLNNEKPSKAVLYENGKKTKMDNCYYYDPTYLAKSYFSRPIEGNSYPNGKSLINSNGNVFDDLVEPKSEFILEKSQFDKLYSDFNNDQNISDNSYELIRSISKIEPKLTELDQKKYLHFINWNNTIDDPVLGTLDSWREKIGPILSETKNEHLAICTWGEAYGFNMLAWMIYENTEEDELLRIARRFVERALEMHQEFLNLDTYARILYKLGEKEKAYAAINKAIEFGENNDGHPLNSYPQGAFEEYSDEFKSYRDQLKSELNKK